MCVMLIGSGSMDSHDGNVDKYCEWYDYTIRVKHKNGLMVNGHKGNIIVWIMDHRSPNEKREAEKRNWQRILSAIDANNDKCISDEKMQQAIENGTISSAYPLDQW